MKNIIIPMLTFLLSQVCFGQISKGNLLAGGTISYNSSKMGSSENTELGISPNAGYFFMDRFAGGLRLDYVSTDNEWNSGTNSMLFGPFLRYYFLPKEQKLNLFADAGYGFGSLDENEAFRASVNGYSLMAGPVFFLSPHTALEFSIGYGSLKVEDISDRLNSMEIKIGFQVHIVPRKK